MPAAPTLIFGVIPRVAVPVARSLARRGIPVFWAGLGCEYRPVRSRAIKQFFSLPEMDISDPGLFQQLVELIKREGIDYLIPCNDSSLRYLSYHHEALSKYAKPACPRADAAVWVLDKDRTVEASRACGVPVPRELKTATATLDRIQAELAFPIVVKPRRKLTEQDFKVRYFHAVDDLRSWIGQRPDLLDDYFVQEYCPGDGVGVELLMIDNSAKLVFQHRRLTEHPRSGGVSVVAVSESPDPVLTDMAVRLLRRIGWQGVAMVEFRHDRRTGRTALMEVNGRYWGSLGLSAVCGVDFPYIQWAYDHSLRPDLPIGNSSGVRARWTAGVLSNVIDATRPKRDESFWKELSRSVRELSPRIRDMLFDWADPIPAVQEVFQLLVKETWARTKFAARRIMPRSMWNEVVFARKYGPRFALLLRSRRARRRAGSSKISPNARHVLFVCHGNIIRSALAARLFERGLPPGAGLTATSAGLFAKNGKPADPRAIEAARSLFALDLSTHHATALTNEEISRADAVFVMDGRNETFMLQRFPEAAAKVFLLGEFDPAKELPDFEIADPYEGSLEDVAGCYRTVSRCVDGVLHALLKKDL